MRFGYKIAATSSTPQTPGSKPAANASESAKPAAAAAGAANNAAGFVKVDTVKLDSLIDLVGELVISESMVVQDPELLKLAKDNQYERKAN